MATTVFHRNNVTLSTTPLTSPTFTFPSRFDSVQATYIIPAADQTDTSLTISFQVQVENSQGGWDNFFGMTWQGHVNPKTGAGTNPMMLVSVSPVAGQRGRIVGSASRSVTGSFDVQGN